MKLTSLLLSLSLTTAVFADDSGWVDLFNGENLDGWTPKFANSPLGENVLETFQVEDGILKANYDNWEKWENRFGHLYSDSSYSRYILRLEFKFLPFENLADAQHWTARNSGVMIHSQSPLTLSLSQWFPTSLEGQFLCEGTTAGTHNGNIVTPGTHITFDGEFATDHIISSTYPLPKIGEWVSFEAEVHGHDLIIYRVNGEEVLRFKHPVLDDQDEGSQRLLAAGANPKVDHGHIALQAEGHPIWFRNIQIKPLD